MRKAQATFFVILGILSLLSIIAVVYISSLDFSNSNVDVSSNNVVLQQCISEQFENSLRIASLKGGYVSVKEDVPSFIPFNSYKMPLWKKDNVLYIPETSFVEEQLSKDLKNRILEYCIPNESIRSVLKNNIDVKVLLSEDENKAVVKFNTFENKDSYSKEFGVYEVKNSIPFLKMFNVAKSFYSEIENKEVLKSLSNNVIAMNKNIPNEGLSFDCEKKVWNVEDVKTAFLKSMSDISTKVSFNGVPKVNDDIVKKHFTFSIDAVKNNNVIVKMIFKDSYDSFFKVDGVDGNFMTSFVTKNPGVGCRNSYSFYYDYSIPVIFSLYDEDEDYYFKFAVPIEVYRNQVSKDPEEKLSLENNNVVDDNFEVVEEYKDENNNDVTVRSKILSDFCSKTTYDKIRIVVKDNNDEPVNNVVSYIQCGSQQCYLDVNDNVINSPLPSNCGLGTIYITKQGYALKTLDYKINSFSSLIDKEVILDKLYNFILKLSCDNDNCDFNDFSIVVYNNEDNSDIPIFLSTDGSFASIKPKDGKISFAIIKTTNSGFEYVDKKSFDLNYFDKGTDYYIVVNGKNYAEDGFYTFDDITFIPQNDYGE